MKDRVFVNFYVSRMKDADDYHVVRNVQRYTGTGMDRMFPRDDERRPIIHGLTREEACVTARACNAAHGSSRVSFYTRRIEGLCEDNPELAEAVSGLVPVAY